MGNELETRVPALACHVILAAGRAPAHWQRQLTQDTAQLKALQRSSSWVETLRTACPTLRDEPLLGRCLEARMDQVPRSGEEQMEESFPSFPRWTWPESASQRDRKRGPVDDRAITLPRALALPEGLVPEERPPPRQREPQARRPKPVPSGLGRRVGRTRLGQLAGESALAAGREPSPGRPGQGLPQTKARAPSPVCREPGKPRDWLRGLAERADRALRRDGRMVESPPRPAPSDLPEPDEVRRSTGPWGVRLDGLPAPAELLRKLFTVPSDDGEGPGSESPRGLETGRSRATRSGVQPATSASQPARLDGAMGPGDGIANRETGPGPIPVPVPAEGSPVGAPQAGTNGPGEGSTRLAPPVVASSLAPLLPPQMAGMPPAPVATVAARPGARPEEAPAVPDEDLGRLADRIKRILDEEARRHGIDV